MKMGLLLWAFGLTVALGLLLYMLVTELIHLGRMGVYAVVLFTAGILANELVSKIVRDTRETIRDGKAKRQRREQP